MQTWFVWNVFVHGQSCSRMHIWSSLAYRHFVKSWVCILIHLNIGTKNALVAFCADHDCEDSNAHLCTWCSWIKWLEVMNWAQKMRSLTWTPVACSNACGCMGAFTALQETASSWNLSVDAWVHLQLYLETIGIKELSVVGREGVVEEEGRDSRDGVIALREHGEVSQRCEQLGHICDCATNWTPNITIQNQGNHSSSVIQTFTTCNVMWGDQFLREHIQDNSIGSPMSESTIKEITPALHDTMTVQNADGISMAYMLTACINNCNP